MTANTLADGTYDITATLTDAAGNISTDTTTNELTIKDTITPTADVRSYKRINGISYGFTEVKAGDVIIVNAEFSEDMADTPPIQITGTGVDPTTAANMTKFNATTYYYLWTVGDVHGEQKFILSQGTDLAGNVMEPAFSVTITVNNNAADSTPTVNTQKTNDPTPTITGTTGTGIALTTGETLSVALDGTTYTPTVATDGTWSLTANTLADGTYDITATITDAAGDTGADTTTSELMIDTIAPTLASHSPADGATGVSAFNNIVLIFDEPVAKGSGNVHIIHSSRREVELKYPPTLEDLNASVRQITGYGTNKLTIEPLIPFDRRDGEYIQVNIQATAFDDLAGNSFGFTTFGFNSKKDTTSPTVGLRYFINGPYGTPVSQVTAGDVVTVLATFSELVVDITKGSDGIKITGTGADNIPATNMAWAGLDRWPYAYTQTFIYEWTVGTGGGIQAFTLSHAMDLFGNAVVSEPTFGATITIKDTTSPTAELSYFKRINGISYDIAKAKTGDIITVTATFNEDMAQSPVVQISGTGVDNILAINMTRVNATTYHYFWVVGTGLGEQTFTLSQGEDLAGNVITATPTSGATITIIDTTTPTVELSYHKRINGISYGITEANAGDVIIISAEFSKDMANSPSVQITGTGLEPIAATNMTRLNATSYNYIWTVGTDDGTQTFRLSQGEDLTGNAVVSVSTVIIVSTLPTARLHYYHINDDALADQVQAGHEVRVIATFSEDMAQSPAVQISGTGANNIDITGMTRVSTRTYTYDWTVGTGLGEQTFILSNGTDLEGNEMIDTLTSGGTITVAEETIRPTAALSYYLYDADANPPMSDDPETKLYPENTYRIRAEFSEDMAQSPAVRLAGVGAQIIAVDMTRVSPTVYHYFWTVADSVDIQVFTLSQGTDLAGNEIIAEPTSSSGRIQVENRAGVCVVRLLARQVTSKQKTQRPMVLVRHGLIFRQELGYINRALVMNLMAMA